MGGTGESGEERLMDAERLETWGPLSNGRGPWGRCLITQDRFYRPLGQLFALKSEGDQIEMPCH